MKNEQLAQHILVRMLGTKPELKGALELLLAELSQLERTEFLKDLLACDVNLPLADALRRQAEPAVQAIQLHKAFEAFAPREPLAWLVDGLIAIGSVSVLVGDPGSGKTWAMLQLALSVAAGKAWMERPLQAGTVLWLDYESGKNRMLDRLKRVMLGLNISAQDVPFYFITAGDRLFDLRKTDDINLLQVSIINSGARLCVIDALADIMPGADENAVKDIQPLFLALRKIADVTSCAFLLIHHNNKNGGYRGSTAIAGAVDLMMQVSRENAVLNFESKKTRDTEPFRFSALLSWGGQEFWMMKSLTSAAPKKLSAAEKYVVEYMQAHGGHTTTPEVMTDAAANGENSNSIRKAVADLRERSLIERTNPDAPNGVAAQFRLKVSGQAG